jgi:hypothetical protein
VYLYVGLTLVAAAFGWFKLYAAVTTDPPASWERLEFEMAGFAFVFVMALWNGFLVGSAAMIAGKHRFTMAIVTVHSAVAGLGVLARGLMNIEFLIVGILVTVILTYFSQRKEMFVSQGKIRVGNFLPAINVRAMWVVVLVASGAIGIILHSFTEDSALAWFTEGYSLSQAGKHDEAVVAYRKAIRFKSGYGEAWHNLGLSHGNLGNHLESAAAHEEAARLKPNDPEVWFALGYPYEQLNSMTKLSELMKRLLS